MKMLYALCVVAATASPVFAATTAPKCVSAKKLLTEAKSAEAAIKPLIGIDYFVAQGIYLRRTEHIAGGTAAILIAYKEHDHNVIIFMQKDKICTGLAVTDNVARSIDESNKPKPAKHGEE